jgi:hypothetical protein
MSPQYADLVISSDLADCIIFDLQERLKHCSVEDVKQAEDVIQALCDCYRVTLTIKSD